MVLVRDVVERLSAAGQLPPADRLVGEPSAELDARQQQLGMKLPTDDRTFMEVAGPTHDPAAPMNVSPPLDLGGRKVKRIAGSFRAFLLVGLDD